MKDDGDIDYFKLLKAINNCKGMKKQNRRDLKLTKVFRNAFSLCSLNSFVLAGISDGIIKNKGLTIFCCALGGISLLATGAMVWMKKRIEKSNEDCDKTMNTFKKIGLERFNYIVEDEEDEDESRN